MKGNNRSRGRTKRSLKLKLRSTSILSEAFALFIWLNAIKFVYPGYVSLLLQTRFALTFEQNNCPIAKNVHFLLTCLAQNALCIRAIIG